MRDSFWIYGSLLVITILLKIYFHLFLRNLYTNTLCLYQIHLPFPSFTMVACKRSALVEVSQNSKTDLGVTHETLQLVENLLTVGGYWGSEYQLSIGM